jgi:excisionase family DNA binding protein
MNASEVNYALEALLPRTPRGRLIGIPAAADRADVCTRTIRRWIADGRLTGWRTGPKLIKIDVDELDRLIRPVPAAGGSDAA